MHVAAHSSPKSHVFATFLHGHKLPHVYESPAAPPKLSGGENERAPCGASSASTMRHRAFSSCSRLASATCGGRPAGEGPSQHIRLDAIVETDTHLRMCRDLLWVPIPHTPYRCRCHAGGEDGRSKLCGLRLTLQDCPSARGRVWPSSHRIVSRIGLVGGRRGS